MASGQLHRNVPPLGRLRSIRMILHGAGLLHGIMYNNVKFNLIAYSSLLKEKKNPVFYLADCNFLLFPPIFSVSPRILLVTYLFFWRRTLIGYSRTIPRRTILDMARSRKELQSRVFQQPRPSISERDLVP